LGAGASFFALLFLRLLLLLGGGAGFFSGLSCFLSFRPWPS
jgi:hypothetical protein